MDIHQTKVAGNLKPRHTSAPPECFAEITSRTHRGQRAHRVPRISALFLETFQDTTFGDNTSRHELESEVEVALDEPGVARSKHFGVLSRSGTEDEVNGFLPFGPQQRESDGMSRN